MEDEYFTNIPLFYSLRPYDESCGYVTDCSLAADTGNLSFQFFYFVWHSIVCQLIVKRFFMHVALISYCVLLTDSYDSKLTIVEGESVYDFCWYPFMSASSTLFVSFHIYQSCLMT